jgi:hypothetical protein
MNIDFALLIIKNKMSFCGILGMLITKRKVK